MSKNTISSVVNTIVDTAFVPDMREREPETAESKMSAFFASMANCKVKTPSFAMPENGMHAIVISEYEFRNGFRDNSDYFQIALRDLDKNITWNMTLPAVAEDVMEFLGELNMYNNGIVYGLDPMKAFDRLTKRGFNVWTQQYLNDKGEKRVKTYVNPVKYEKFARYCSYKESLTKKAEEAYLAHKKDEAAK